ncbi:MAG: aldo/keto reductase [Magnetococcales bacterium]|nr:aldo/keto reductase [Magnetococcales bacterium]
MKRREFIQSSAALAVGAVAGAVPSEGEAREDKSVIKKYKRVGRTEMKISDISFGAGQLSSSALVLRAIDRGINYFDTAPDYGESEKLIGQALKRVENREKIYLASKFCDPISYSAGKSHLQVGASKADYIASVDGSLKRLGVDYLDVVFVHAIGERNQLDAEKRRLLDPNMLAAVESLKKAGKMRYLAVSSHGPYHLEELMLEAVNSNHFDLIMPSFNFMKFPRIPEVLKEAKKRGVGVIAMKTLAGARDSGVAFEPGVFEQSALRWVLHHEEVDGLVVTFKSVNHLNDYLPASGQVFTWNDQRHLDRYAALHGSNYCRTGCGECASSCPDWVDIAAILRYQMYFESYGDEKKAMVSYSNLDNNAEGCLGCEQPQCDSACRYGLAVGEKLRAAHRTLTMQSLSQTTPQKDKDHSI